MRKEVMQQALDALYSDNLDEQSWAKTSLMKAIAKQEQPATTGSIEIDFKQATELLQMFGGEPTLITLMNGDGHSGEGLYAYYTEIPEEGVEYLGETADEATPSAQPAIRFIRLRDSDWVNICNARSVLDASHDDAVAIAVSLAEEKLKELNSIAQPVQPPLIEPMRKHVEDFARKCGWEPSSPEGAFECAQRTSYAQGLEDGYAKRVRIESIAQPVQSDYDRMTWLNSQNLHTFNIFPLEHSPNNVEIVVVSEWERYRGRTLREAIDAAMDGNTHE